MPSKKQKREAPPPPPSSSDEEYEEEIEEKNKSPLPPKPTTNQSDEEEDEDEDEDGSDEDEDQQPATKPKTPNPPQPTKAQESSTEEEEDDDDDEDESPAAPIKPISTKPMDQKQAAQDSRSPNKKKPEPAVESHSEDGQKKQQLFQRIWSLEDELSVLRGFTQYKARNGSVDLGGFYDFVRGSVRTEISKGQLANKLRQLKKKFENNLVRAKNGAELSFSSQHDKEAYELSNKIWGSAVRDKLEGEDGREHKRAKVDNGRARALSSKVELPYLLEAVDEISSQHSCGVALKISLGMANETKAMFLEDKVKQIKKKETKLQLRRIELVKESVKLISDALTRSD